MLGKLAKLMPLVLMLVTWPHSRASDAPAACAPTPSTMRAARVHGSGGSEALRIEQVPVPTPTASELLVRVHYASVNPVDWKLMLAGRLPYPAIAGGDFAGEVVATGANAATFACGDLVAGIVNQRERGGSYAEYVVVPVSEIVPKPDALSMAEAAA